MGKRLNGLIEKILTAATWLGAGLTMGVLLFLVGYVLVKGVRYLKPSLFAFTYNSANVSMFPSIITTVILTVFTLMLAVPMGIFAAIYMTEYAKRGNKFVKVVRITTETLSGIPSIVYGLFGMLCFVTAFKWRLSMLSGGFTMAIMILPLIMRTTEEALRAVPDGFREGAFALGAGKLRTVFVIVLPAAVPGILAGVILAIGRIVGETAALIYTAGSSARIPASLTQSASTLSIHMWKLSSEGLHTNEAFATAVVLLLVVVGINALSAFAARKLSAAL